MNGLERLLLWASIYPSFMKPYQHYAYLRGFEKKHQYAQDIRNSVGLDSENNLIKFQDIGLQINGGLDRSNAQMCG